MTEFVRETDEGESGSDRQTRRAEADQRRGRPGHSGRLAVIVALGVVFGDIGTSPLYALRTAFTADGGAVRIDRTDVYGVTSMVLWSITVVVTLKYVVYVLRADNDGEGGVMALVGLVREALPDRPDRAARLREVMVTLGLVGACLFYGDSMITPAISVLSAVEGLEVAAPSLRSLVVPIAAVILTGLFAAQRWGTGRVGAVFGPVMLFWFGCLFVTGVGSIVRGPAVLAAVSPTYAIGFLVREPSAGFVALGAVVLAITGAEALYADVGHVGRRPIRIAWLTVVFPALAVSYVGQAASVLHRPSSRSNPLVLMEPGWARIPGVVIATVATVIASQAVISGAFSISRQAIRLGFLPPLRIRHTSNRDAGQVYLPAVNWALFVGVLALVLAFRSSARLASAYGVAVTGTFLVDTALFLVVVHHRWHWPVWRTALLGSVFGIVEATFLGANVSKIAHGAWIPLAIAAAAFVVTSTWRRGHQLLVTRRADDEDDLAEFAKWLRRNDIQRVPGTAIFPHNSDETTPAALRAVVDFDQVMHERIVVAVVQTANVPRVSEGDRTQVERIGDDAAGIIRVTLVFGYQEHADLPTALQAAGDRGLCEAIDPETAAYVLSGTNIHVARPGGLRRWRKHLFVAMSRNAVSPADYLGLPEDRTIWMSSIVDI